MFELLSKLLKENQIEFFAPLPLSECDIQKPYLLEREGISSGTAVIFLMPYLSAESGHISAYAVPRDYHLFFKMLSDELLAVLRTRYPENKFAAFADHSPINEINAASKAGLGVIGEHGLLITEKYSSFVFLGEIFTDIETESKAGEIKYCEGCGLCKNACPVALDKSKCISALTQKKGELNEKEIELIKKCGMAWGCDLCQNVCPHTKKTEDDANILSPIPFFNENRLVSPTYGEIEAMSDEEFSSRAYSWRGRPVILRNLKILKK